MVKIQTQEGNEHEISHEIACKSLIIKNMLEDIGDNGDTPIPLSNVSAEIFVKVVEWCEHHKADPPVVDENGDDLAKSKNSDEIDEWDRNFAKLDNEVLFKLILAANYLDIKPLLDLGCKTVANMIKGKTPEQIREHFGLVNDFTPEEEEQIRKENAWAEEA